MADEKKRLTSYPEATELQDDDYVMVDNGGPEGTKKFLAKNLGGGFAPVLLGEFSSTAQPAGTDLTINDCSDYSWLIVEYEKPNESMAGYNGPFRKIGWIPTDSMTEGSTQEIGIAYNDVSATSMAVTAILPMISIKDSTHIRIIASSGFLIHRIWGI